MARYYPPGGGTGGSGSSVDLDQITVPRRLVPSGYKTLTSDSIGEIVEGTLPLLKGTAFGDSSNDIGAAFESSPIKLAVNNNAVAGFDYVLNGYFDDTVNGTMTRVHIPNCIPSNIAAGVKVGGKNAYLVGTFSADATAIASDIKMGKTVYVNGIKVTGTMPVRTAIDSTLTAGSSVEMPEGYYPAGKVTAKSLADQTKANAVAAHILKGDTAWIDGVLVTGSMPNIASIDAVKSLYNETEVSTLFARISKGAHITDATSGYPEVSIPYADIVSASGITADKIAAGNSIFGVAGTFSSDANAVAEDLREGKKAYVNGQLIVGTGQIKEIGTFGTGTAVNATINKSAVAFKRSKVVPGTSITKTDISQNKDGSIVTWYDSTAKIQYWYTAKDEVYLNANSASMFSGMSAVTNIEIDFNTSKVTNISSIFSGCSALTSLNLIGFGTGSVTNFQNMFLNCNRLTTITYDPYFIISDSVLSTCTLGNVSGNNTLNMYKNCPANKIIGSWIPSDYSYNTDGTLVQISEATFVSGSAFNTIINKNATQFLKTENPPSSSVITSDISVEKDGRIITWYDSTSTTQYWYSNAPKYKIYLNATISDMFANCTKLQSMKLESNLCYNSEKIVHADRVFLNCTSLTDVTIEGGESISMAQIFKGCTKLQDAWIRLDSETSLINAKEMFYGCISMSKMYLSYCYSLTDISYMFYNCKSLTSVNLDGGLAAVTTMAYAFYGCENLETVSLGYNDGRYASINVLDASYMFYNCKKLDFGRWYSTIQLYHKCTNANSMFEGCESMTTHPQYIFDDENGNTTPAKIKMMSRMFYNCYAMDSLYVYGLENCTDMSYMCYNCRSLSDVTLSNLNLSAIETTESMFEGCTNPDLISMHGIDMGENLSKLTNMSKMFKGCTLSNDNIREFMNLNHTADDINLREMFSGCNFTNMNYESSSGFYMSQNARKKCNNNDNTNPTWHMFYNVPSSKIALFNWPGYWEDGTYISAGKMDANNYNVLIDGAETFKRAYSVPSEGTTDISYRYTSDEDSSVVTWLDSNDTKIQYYYTPYNKLILTDGYEDDPDFSSINIFKWNSVIKTIDLSTCITNISNLREMFAGCSSLVNIKFPTMLKPIIVTYGMFENCASLKSVDLSIFDLTDVMDVHNMFNGCSSITSLNVSSINTSKVIDMSYMFSSCTSLTTLDISSFDVGNVTNMEGLFDGYGGNTLTLFKTLSKKVTNMCNMFVDCANLTTINNIQYIDTSSVINMNGMFSYCPSLTKLDLSKFNTINVTDMTYMFFMSDSLSNITYSSNFVIGPNLDVASSYPNGTRFMFNDCPANKPNWTGGTWNSSGTFIRS